jgi:class 3 adenylate cyclase/tetratricopeptide (TPR) repeat protein
MQCSKCQTENPENKKFCRKCGTKLSLSCPQCGSEVLSDDLFCGDCGQSLKEPKEASPIDYSEPQSYTPKFLADKILTTRSSIEGERKLVTVFFADVASYTSMAEKLDPEEIHQIMDGCFKILMDEIHRYEGTINQFTGDGVMALFGAPVAHEDHAQRACYTALSIQKSIGEYGRQLKRDSGTEFKMRIGLNSGPVIVGAIGDDLRMDYTAVGDTTNLASRMESMARPASILVSNHTHKMARDFFEFESLGKVEVKGKKEPVEAHELVKASEIETRIEAAQAKGLTEFVGRQGEMEALKEAFDKAKAGSGQVVGIVGEAGVGKSRLMLELRRILSKEAYTYIEGRCLHYGSSMAYLPVLDILRSYLEVKEGDRESLIKKKMVEKVMQLDEELRGALPPFHDLLSLKVEDEAYLRLEPIQKKEKTFEAIRDLLVRESQVKPLVLAIEDVHWIDSISEELLTYLIKGLANTNILLILLYRPEYVHTWGSKSYYNQVGVDQLSPEANAALVQSVLEGAEIVPELRELILSRTGGNPLFVEEFTHGLLENGCIRKKDERYVLNKDISDIQVPDTVQGIIAARLDRLEDNLKHTLQVASVIGRDFAFRILKTITGIREELKPYLLDLQELEFVYEKRLFPDLEYVFKNTLTQEVAYNSLLQKKKKAIHEKIGKAIEEIYAERLEEFYEILAYHATAAGQKDSALDYLILASEKAHRAAAHREEATLLSRAITIAEESGEKDVIADLRARCGRAYAAIGLWKNAKPELEEALRGLPSDAIARQAEVMADLAITCFWLMDPVGLRDYCNKTLSIAKKVNRRDLEFAAISGLAGADSLDGRMSSSMEQYELAITQSKKYGTTVPGHALEFYPLELYWVGRLDEAIEWSRKAIQTCGEVGDTFLLIRALSNLGISLASRGRYIEALQIFKEAQQIGIENDCGQALARATVMLGGVHLELYDFKTAQAITEEAKEIASHLDFKAPLISANIDLLFNFARSGEVGEAEALIDEVAVPVKQTKGWHGWLWRIRLSQAQAEISLVQGDGEKAIQFADKSLYQSQETGRIKYQAAALETRGKALVLMGKKRNEGIADLQKAIQLVRPVQDPLMFLRPAYALLCIEKDDKLMENVNGVITQVKESLLNTPLHRPFIDSEPVKVLSQLMDDYPKRTPQQVG